MQNRSLSPVGTCDQHKHHFILNLNPGLSSYGNMALVATTFDTGGYPSACEGLCKTPDGLSTPREVQGHHNAWCFSQSQEGSGDHSHRDLP